MSKELTGIDRMDRIKNQTILSILSIPVNCSCSGESQGRVFRGNSESALLGRGAEQPRLVQRAEKFFPAARARGADAAFGRAERGGDFGVGRRVCAVEEQREEPAAALVKLGERGANEVLLF